MSVEFRIDPGDLEGNPAIVEWFQLFAKECLREAQLIASERIKGGTGAYERSFTFELKPGSPPSLKFGNVASHAIYVEEDTVEHTFGPKNKKALRWFSPPGGGEGAAVFATKVKIPARDGQHIVRDAVAAAGDRLRANP
jgi:hypothetical protein